MDTSRRRSPGLVDLGAAFDLYAADLYWFCLRRVADQSAAEDLVSIIFLEAWRSRARAIYVDDSLRPWLYGVAINVLRNTARSRRRHAAALARFAAEPTVESEADPADSLCEREEAQRRADAVHAALARLSPKRRAVAEMCLLEGCTAREAAVALRLPEGTVKSRLADARSQLRSVIHLGEPPRATDPSAASGHEQGDERAIGARGRKVGS